MGITVKNNVRLKEKFEARLQAIEREMKVAINDAQAGISIRTQGGSGVDGSSFAPYSETYKHVRADRGYQTGPVNLTVTGDMLRAITNAVDRFGQRIVGRIFFNRTSSVSPITGKAASSVNKARWTNALRRWFGLSQQQRATLKETLKNAR